MKLASRRCVLMSIRPRQMEMFVASQTAERLGANDRLLEMILERRNMFRALNQVRANKGAPGIDKMSVKKIGGYLRRHWPKIKEDLLSGQYRPLPVRRKEIDKPDGGIRLLGIPTVLDRVIQQAIAQIMEQIWDPTFSEFSYGFRPGRSAHDAVLQSKQYLLDGYTYVVDMDLSKFFDRVNHDRLMSRLATRVKDKRVLKLVRRYLNAGTMINGVITHADEGTPQGGPMTPRTQKITWRLLPSRFLRWFFCTGDRDGMSDFNSFFVDQNFFNHQPQDFLTFNHVECLRGAA
ncbi:MAG: reverse transcriptase domain-containing protein [Desulfatitalea sp.]